MTEIFYFNTSDWLEFTPESQSEQVKWKRQPTWRERIASGNKTWDDYRRYRLLRLDTEDMEYQGLDEVIHICIMEMEMTVVNKEPMMQGYLTLGENT